MPGEHSAAVSRSSTEEGNTDSRDVLTRAARPPDLVVRYGSGPEHIADIRLPAAAGLSRPPGQPAIPLVLFLHGGFWRAAFDRAHTGPLAVALAEEGFAVCTPEYRRVGQPGGGWHGTLDDVAAAVDTLPSVVAEASAGLVDAGRILVAGHSAGGHLALWAAARHRLRSGSPWRLPGSSIRGVVGLAAVCDLASCFEQDLGHGAAAALMGGSPASHPDRYSVADPARLLPTGVAVRLVHGSADDRVPCQMSRDYAALAQSGGDDADCTVLPRTGHFEVIDPLSAAWPDIVAAFRSSAFGTGPAVISLGQPP
jgi:acetyl esterase/lipase